MTIQLKQFQSTLKSKARHRTYLVTGFLLIFLLFSAPASAAPTVPNKEAASLMSQCMLDSKATYPEMKVEGRAKCCSKSLGYCIYCPANKGRKCIKTAHSSTIDRDRNKINLPPTGGVVAPTPRPAPKAYDYRMQTPRPAPNVYDHR